MNDGGVGSKFLYDDPPKNGLSSFLPILTPVTPNTPAPVVNYLSPVPDTIFGKTQAEVSELEVLGTLSASIPRPDGPDLELTQSIALNQKQSDYRAIIIVPGLLLEKPEHDQIPPNVNSLFLFVKMMCGCPITTGPPHSDWVSTDFVVSAEIFLKNGQRIPQSMTLFSDSTPSLFSTPLADVSQVRMANYSAIQKSTGNVGFLSVIYLLG